MKISSRGRYAVRVLVDIAVNSGDGQFVSITDIAKRQHIAVKYLEQIVSKLTKNGLLTSSRGAQGGYLLAYQPKDITIAKILGITGDLPELAPCFKNIDCPNRNSCTSIGVWETLNGLIYNYLSSVTLQNLIEKNAD